MRISGDGRWLYSASDSLFAASVRFSLMPLYDRCRLAARPSFCPAAAGAWAPAADAIKRTPEARQTMRFIVRHPFKVRTRVRVRRHECTSMWTARQKEKGAGPVEVSVEI